MEGELLVEWSEGSDFSSSSSSEEFVGSCLWEGFKRLGLLPPRKTKLISSSKTGRAAAGVR